MQKVDYIERAYVCMHVYIDIQRERERARGGRSRRRAKSPCSGRHPSLLSESLIQSLIQSLIRVSIRVSYPSLCRPRRDGMKSRHAAGAVRVTYPSHLSESPIRVATARPLHPAASEGQRDDCIQCTGCLRVADPSRPSESCVTVAYPSHPSAHGFKPPWPAQTAAAPSGEPARAMVRLSEL